MANRVLTLLAVGLFALPLTFGAGNAQERPPEPDQPEVEADVSGQHSSSETDELVTDEDVQESLSPLPDEAGVRSPLSTEEEGQGASDLYSVLATVRDAPPGLDGTPISRPNALASNPETEMAPAQPRDAYLFPENYIE